jgi:hypothetical protein
MKKFPRISRARRSLPRTVIISRRGGAATSESGSSLGDQTIYVASVPGGKADLEMSFVGGVAHSLTITVGRSLELFNYALGPSGAFNGDFGWDGAGLLVAPYLRQVAEENFETYALGGFGEAALTDGTGWNGAAALSTPYVRVAGEETFETYDLGAISESALTAGTGWNGSAALHAY